MPNEGLLAVHFSHQNGFTINVVDNGKGISREHLPNIMEPFFSTKNGNYNYGMGLSYAYNVMKKHKGNLLINSKENKGTTVQLQFPEKRVLK